MAARLHHLRRQPVHLDVFAVDDDDALIRVEQQQALRHVADRRVELAVGVGERAQRLVDHLEREGADGEEHAKAKQPAHDQERRQIDMADREIAERQ